MQGKRIHFTPEYEFVNKDHIANIKAICVDYGLARLVDSAEDAGAAYPTPTTVGMLCSVVLLAQEVGRGSQGGLGLGFCWGGASASDARPPPGWRGVVRFGTKLSPV